MARGFAPPEAANLVAYLNELPIAVQAWTLREVSVMLFLRSLQQGGRFGRGDGDPPP